MDEFHPSIIFLDQSLPGGIDLIPVIRTFDENIKIVVISEDATGAIRQTTFGENGTYFLSNPFSIQSVNDVIKTIG